ncbi:MAG: toxin-antitoxin system YwqK family antitoxin [Pirellulales bacterium]|nr:toxin-antitoxin system YwqK family antitoxin [Pirellulales bacterium]
MRQFSFTSFMTCGVAALVLGATASAYAAETVYLDEPTPPPPPKAMGKLKIPEKYEDGKVRVEREVIRMSDDTVVNDGLFTEYYHDGQKFAEGTFKQGIHNGTWTFWHPNGQICKVVTFVDGLPDGEWDVFDEKGNLAARKGYAKGLRAGTWTTYYDDGKTPKIVQSWKDNKLTGERRTFHPNGKVNQESHFVDGLLDGMVVEHDPSGRKTAEANFKAGKREGKFTQWAPDGTATVVNYRDDKPVME